MANSITLSQSLIDDIAQKIADGTATAEQVVLYTKGLNQLQTGNDFQSVTIGLSQSAVDAIDSANAQFQEDATTALATFSQTAANIDTSVSDAVSAINTAKDVLVATDAEISNTISGLPSLGLIRESIKSDRDYVHPYERPCFWSAAGINQTTREAIITWYNHYGKRVKNPDWGSSQIVIAIGNEGYDTTNNVIKNGNSSTYHRFNAGNSEPFKAYRTSTSQTGYEMGMTKSKNLYGHVMGTWSDTTGIWMGYNGSWSSTWMRDCGVIVGDTDKTWFLNRTDTNFYVGGTRGIVNYNNSYTNRANLRNNLTALPAVRRDYEDSQWTNTHERFTLGAPVSTGYGNVCYNKNLNQMVVMKYNDSAGRQLPLLYTFADDFNLKDVAKGTQAISNGYDPIANGKMTLAIQSTVDNSVGMPAAPSIAEANYRGVPVLCDNGKIVHFRSQGSAAESAYGFRWTLNADQTDYIKDAEFRFASGQTTSYGYEQGDYYGVRHTMSNDGRYVIAIDNYYYYHGGARVLLIRVSDGKCIKWSDNQTSWGWSYTPVQRSKFILKLEPHHETSNMYLIDLDHVFENNADNAQVNLIGGNTNPLWMPEIGNIEPYNGYASMNIDYNYEMDFIDPVDKYTDIRTIS